MPKINLGDPIIFYSNIHPWHNRGNTQDDFDLNIGRYFWYFINACFHNIPKLFTQFMSHMCSFCVDGQAPNLNPNWCF